MKVLATCILTLALTTSGAAKNTPLGESPALISEAGIVNLRTESMETPLGIDEPAPLFSWQMRSNKTGACQKGYQLTVNDESGKLVFDSGVVMTDNSINVPYRGKALLGSTRYFWKVRVLDQDGQWLESEPSWFETGLMGIGWNNAEWIGSDKVGASRYRTTFILNYDVKVAKGSSRAVFAYGAKDKDNYITVALDVEKSPSIIVEYAVEGDLRHSATIDVSDIIQEKSRYDTHNVRIQVTTNNYHRRELVKISLDGKVLNPSGHVLSGRQLPIPNKITISPYTNGEYITDWARLYSIGFKQPKGQKATFSNIFITEDNWKATLYTDPVKEHVVKGTGELDVWEPYGLVSAPMLRKNVNIRKPVKSARLYVTARGIYEFYINGKRVSNDYFNPGWTDYRYRIMYNSYDITDMLHQGSNGLGAMLGTGWFSDLNIFSVDFADPYGIRQSLLAKILLTYEDGSQEIVVTDSSWKKYDNGPVTRNGFQNGEDYDARKEVDGWKEGGFDDSAWENAVVFDRPAASVEIQAYIGLPIRNNITLNAISVSEPVKGTFVYDFGQNLVGVPRLEGMKGKAGQVINLRYGEMIYPETIPTDPVAPYTVETYREKRGQVYVENYRGAISVDNYTMRGSEEGETYQPVFTDHGFRYVSVTGLDEPLPIDKVKGVVLESIGEATSLYECSNEDINKLFLNAQWGQRGNFQSVPTDCPQRDERQGWTGDAQVFARTATYYSPWVDKFYTRWFYSLRDNQGTDGSYPDYAPTTGRPPYGYKNDEAGHMGWMEAGIIVPWQVYQQFGDIRVLEEHYSSMVRYMDYLEKTSQDYLATTFGRGDHLAIESTYSGLTNTAYYAYDAYLMTRIAKALGKTEDSVKYLELYENIKLAFNRAYVNEDGVTVAPYQPAQGKPADPNGPEAGDIVPVDTQTSYDVPLFVDLFDSSVKQKALDNLVRDIREHDNTLTTGFIGTPYLALVLSENGFDDVAYTLFEQTRYPSWLYPVKQGATTMWERWNSYTIENGFGPVDMNSYNHYAYGAIMEWMFAHSLGIERDEDIPGYKHIILQPKVGGEMSFANGYFESPYGVIRSGWEKTADGYIYSATIPANTTASLKLQASSIDKVSVVSGAEGVGAFSCDSGKVMAELQAGSYEFKIEY